MSSLKRKARDGRCEETESSESDLEVNRVPNKKNRSFMLPRPSASSTLPRSTALVSNQVRTDSGVSRSSKEGETPLITSTQHGTISMELRNVNPGSSSLLGTQAVSKQKQGPENTEESSDDGTSRPPTTGARSRAQFERGLNKVYTNLETFKADINGRLTHIEESQEHSKKQQDLILAKLDEVLGHFERWSSNLDLAPSASDAPADPALHEICRSLDRDGAIGKEFGDFVAPIKNFVRRGVCLALRMPDFKRPPMFYSINGAPDFFPEAFREENGYCQPYPHWNLPFASNYPCIPTLVLFVRSITSNDNTPAGKAARALTDNQIISFICHGPFKSLKLSFNSAKSVSPDDPDIQSAGKRGVSRHEEKFFQRRLYRPQILVMLEAYWDGAWHKGVMSPEASNGSGGFIIKRPRWRAGWFNNFLMALDNARRMLQLAKPGRHIRGERTIEYVEGPPPVLRSNDGELVKIPLCIISKEWRKDNQTWIESMPHLINMSLSKKPDVSAFVDAHPVPAEPIEGEEEGYGQDKGEDEGEGEGEDRGEDDEGGQWEGQSKEGLSDREQDQVNPGQTADGDWGAYGDPQDFFQQLPLATSVQAQRKFAFAYMRHYTYSRLILKTISQLTHHSPPYLLKIEQFLCLLRMLFSLPTSPSIKLALHLLPIDRIRASQHSSPALHLRTGSRLCRWIHLHQCHHRQCHHRHSPWNRIQSHLRQMKPQLPSPRRRERKFKKSITLRFPTYTMAHRLQLVLVHMPLTFCKSQSREGVVVHVVH
ncbi:hypothetical protein RSOL_392930 [Rhizoctonia solani AG-3 Rhs1AP]|uniref:Uncharacterized protein n=1 Tax=Rhizoctonia solani AG-3 Rhs1AP TaxID=1086054 RepID=X8JCE2_9AGAM|nr:hypothetical protein RSOL_392930 [Rhizoctonia solani AG-3 Rhs1AP]